MKHIIEGRTYDTTQAHTVGTDQTSGITLWQMNRSKRYFTEGEDGMPCPLSYDEAREWAEEHLDERETDSAFVDPYELDGMVIMTVRVSATAKALVNQEVAKTGYAKSVIMTNMIMDALGREPQE